MTILGAQKIAVLGAGSWGTALALALARNGHEVTLWAHAITHADKLASQRENKQYLPGFNFPNNLLVSDDLPSLIAQHSIVLVVVPSHAFRATVKQLQTLSQHTNPLLIWATKGFDGFDQCGPFLLSDVVQQELGNDLDHAIVTGPSFSKEVAADLPTALAVAGNTPTATETTVSLFHGGHTRVYSNTDLIGVQVGGACKNVMAIAAGISDGLGYGANARAAIITRGLAEITRLGIAMGACADTFVGLAGLGDLVLTCTDDQSRNRQFGLGLGKGKNIETLINDIGQQVEGYLSVKELVKLADKFSVEMPIAQQVYRVLYENLSPADAVSLLLSRNQVME